MSKDAKLPEDEGLNEVTEQTIEHTSEPITHEWVQRGNDLECHSCPNPHGQVNAIPHGKMLTKNAKGDFDIVSIPGMQVA